MLALDKQYDALPWLAESREQLISLATGERCPHAILLHGTAGIGRRHLAIWLAEALLNTELDVPREGNEREQLHPDLLLIEPEPDKTGISVEQIRNLIHFAELTSHQGAARCAIIYPAELMNTSAANSLLKTLEEPPAGVFIILVCEALSQLPATVISRCQHWRIASPPADVALAWLKSRTSEPDIDAILSFAGGAPLAALALAEDDFAGHNRAFSNDIASLMRKQADPVVIAAKWAKNADLALRWLYCFVAAEIRAELTDSTHAGGPGSRAAQNFSKLQQIRELRRFIGGGVSAELTLTGLLMQWYGAGDPAGN